MWKIRPNRYSLFWSDSCYMPLGLIRNFYKGQFCKIKSPEWSCKWISVRYIHTFFSFFSFFNWMFLKHYHFYALVTELFSGEWCSYSIFFPCVCLVGLWVVSSNQEGLIILKSHQRQSTRKILWLDSFA